MSVNPGIADPSAQADLRIDRILHPMRVILRIAALCLLGLLILTPALQVFMRQFLNMPMIGAEEFSRFMLINVVMLAVPYTISSGASVRMEEALLLLPGRPRAWLTMLIAALGFAAFAFASWSVLTAMMKNLNTATPTLEIPYYIFFCAAGVGFLLAALEFVVIAAKAALGLPLYRSFKAEQSSEELKL
ncbi:MAG: TRAP transporter small permease [Paracoccaceae bacterium]